jgi:hypothetical protein
MALTNRLGELIRKLGVLVFVYFVILMLSLDFALYCYPSVVIHSKSS